jgi:hypothetical protein
MCGPLEHAGGVRDVGSEGAAALLLRQLAPDRQQPQGFSLHTQHRRLVGRHLGMVHGNEVQRLISHLYRFVERGIYLSVVLKSCVEV